MGVITGGPSSLALEDLSNVSIVGPQTGQYLRYNAGISEWQNAFLGSDIYNFLDTNMSGSNGVSITYTPGPNTIGIALSLTASGDATGTVSGGDLPLTLATVNSNVGTYGSGTAIPVVTVNAKGLITGITTASFTGTSPLATSLAGGSTGALPYQTSADNTAFLAAGTSSQLLIGGAGSPSWSSSISGLTSVGATTFTGALVGNASTATTLQTTRTFSASGDATAAAQNFDGSANVTLPLVLATINSNVGTFASVTVNGKGLVTAAADLSGDAITSGSTITFATVNSSPQTDQFRKVTVNGKGLVTATTAVSASDITTALGFTPVNVAGDTMTGYLILNADPVNDLGAVTKQYADAIAAGVNVHAACETSTTPAGNLTAATYNNGASGVGATLTANANGSINSINAGAGVGGYNTLSVSSRILVKDQSTTLQNGIYVVTQLGDGSNPWILTRATDFDGSPSSEISAGDLTYVQEGTLIGTQWVQTAIGTGTPGDYIIVGTDAIVFSQFSGAGTYVAGSGINISSNTISNTGVLSNIAGTGIGVSGATGNVTITNNGVVSATGTTNQINVSGATGNVTFSLPTSVTIGGTMTAGTFSGSGASLTSIPNAALVNSSLTIGSTNIALGATSTTLAGLTSVTATTFIGALSGNATTATTATNVAGGLAGSIFYQTAASTTTTLAAGTSSQVLVSGTTPSWTNTPTLTGTNFSGTAASLNIGGNAGTATTLQTARLINGTSFNGSADITITANNPNAVTFNNTGAGGVSGSSYTGASALTVSYNTIGAPSTTGTNASGTWGINITGNSATVGGFTPSASAGVASRVVVADASGYIQNTYFNSSDNSQASGVTAVMVKAGDNYLRSGTAGAIALFLNGQAVNTTGSLIGPAGNIYHNSSGTAYSNSLQVRELNLAGIQGSVAAARPRLAFHWSGLVASQIAMEPSGRLGIWDNPGTSGEQFMCGSIALGSGTSNTANSITFTNGNYIRNNTGTYGALELVGTQNGYTGFYLGSASGTTTGMYDASGNGGEYDITNGWHTYYLRSAACLAIGGSTTASGYKLRVNGSALVDGNLVTNGGKIYSSYDGTAPVIGSNGDIITRRSTTQGVVYYGDTGSKYLYYDGTNFQLQGGGLVCSGDVTAFSDIRVKKNIEVIADALNKTLQLRGVTFNRTDIGDDTTRHAGVIAQEVEKVLPEVVTTSNEDAHGVEGKKTVAYGNMVGLLIEAIKELNAKVDSLKAELAALKG